MGVTMEHQQYVLLGDLIEEWQEVGLVVMGGGEAQERKGEIKGGEREKEREVKGEGEGGDGERFLEQEECLSKEKPPPTPIRSTLPPPPKGFFSLLFSPWFYFLLLLLE